MKNLILGSLFCLVIVFVGCNRTEDDSATVITSEDITGGVNLYDEGTSILSSHAGMTVTVEGLQPAVSATTDAAGRFTLTNVPFGTYNLVYTKSGYGTFKLMNLSHTNSGGATYISLTNSLGQISTTAVTALSASLVNGDIVISTTVSPGATIANTRYLRFFYSTSSSVSSTNYMKYSDGMVAQINPYLLTRKHTDLVDMGFAAGTTVYVKAYGDSFWANSYLDNVTNKQVFPNLGSSSANAVSFVVP